jgi:hypothetical protein
VVISLRGIGIVGTKNTDKHEETVEKAPYGNEDSKDKHSTV